MKYQIDEAKRVVRANSPKDAVITLPELDDYDGGFIFNINLNEDDNSWEVVVKPIYIDGMETLNPTGKTYTVRETDSNEYEEPTLTLELSPEIHWV